VLLLQAGDPASTVAVSEAGPNAQNGAEGGAGRFGGPGLGDFGPGLLPSRGFGGPQAGR
jgi:hypothetical protein